jgi:hypothetical protein
MKLKINYAFFFLVLCSCCFSSFTQYAQRAATRRAVERNIERDMEKKYADPQRKKGKAEIEKVTYENDKRYQDPNNKVQATLSFETREFNKKGEVKNTTTDKIVFGKTGECMVMQEGSKNEIWFIYNYADKANYMVNVKDKTAMKMPLINFKKMVEKAAKKEAERMESGAQASWQATDERQTINGYSCRKFIYTYPDNPNFSRFDAWVSTEVKLDLSGNYMLGARLSSYQFPENPEYKEMANGFIVRSVLYNKKGNPENQRELIEFKKSADEKYFDMGPFKVMDILSGL